MEIGTVVYYCDINDLTQPDYSIVTKNETFTWAYWVREKRELTFSISNPCYTKVGPPAIGKWE